MITIGWGRTARYVSCFAMFLPACLLSQTATTGQAVAVAPQAEVVLYSPAEADFRAEYERDRVNRKVQAWRQYWSWVQIFYQGNAFSEGWTRFSQVTRDAVKSEVERPAVLATLNELGRLIAQEWAKSASVRRINTNDLRRWNEWIAAARRDDGGSGQHLRNVLNTIRAKAEKLRAP